MISYIFKLLALLLFSIFIILNYYFNFSSHIWFFYGYNFYFLSIGIVYIFYRFIQFNFSKKEVSFSPIKIILLFLINLLIICLYYFFLNNENLLFWFLLFFKIILYSLFPIFLLSITTWFWNKLVSFIPWFWDFWKTANFLLSIALWFSIFIFLITIFAILGLFNLFIIWGILIIFILFSYKNLLNLYKKLFFKNIVFKIKEWYYLKLISSELSFLLWFTFLWIILVTIYKPFPVWWDDLWVYMNYPKLIAQSGSSLSLWWMYSWQIFTWIWYLFKLPTLAFFINSIWFFLSYISLNMIFSSLLKNNKKEKIFIHFPSLLSTIFISLPMIVFQNTLDLKLDLWLFFITIIAVFITYKYFLLTKKKKNISLLVVFIIWLLTGIAFSIKFTSLLLILSIFWTISYFRLWLFWFLGFISLFSWIFTLGNLWEMMNVFIVKDLFLWFCLTIFWTVFLIIWAIRFKLNIKKYFLESTIFLLWIFIAISPWVFKNIYDSYPKITLYKVIKWKDLDFSADFKSYYSKDEINFIQEEWINEAAEINSVTKNEDLLRYLWYENWLLNHVNLFWNVTMQKNQSWDFTNIWFIFFALLPLIFIFLPYKKKKYAYFFIIISFLQFCFYFSQNSNDLKNNDYKQLSDTSIDLFLKHNTDIFEPSFWDDIYDINADNYITDDFTTSLLNLDNIRKSTENYINNLIDIDFNNYKIGLGTKSISGGKLEAVYTNISNNYFSNSDYYYDIIYESNFDNFKNTLYWNFYPELISKVKWNENISLSYFKDLKLSQEDNKLLDWFKNIYLNTRQFKFDDKSWLENYIINNNINESDLFIIQNIWENSRTYKWKIVDFLSKINFPDWYLFLFILFFAPVLYLLLTIDRKKYLMNLFLLNVIFTSVYTFLWLISSFWIVWYWITMYFSFLLMIWISWYYLCKYENNLWSKYIFSKFIWTILVFLFFIIFIIVTAIPSAFNNFKNWSFIEYKTSEVYWNSSIFYYYPDYLNILFTLNIDKNLKEDFLNENIDKNIINNYDWLTKASIIDIVNELNNLSSTENNLNIYAKESLENIYDWIINPTGYYKNKEKIFKVWTYLKYFISENNTRIAKDDLLDDFNDFIYSDDENIINSRFKSLWIDYLLLDLNIATLDNSKQHSLVNRYEKLLWVLKNDNFKLIETDSICLRLWLELYKNNQDFNEYISVIWNTYNSYDKLWNIISLEDKNILCLDNIYELLINNKVDNNNYNFLLPYKYYFLNNNINLSVENIYNIIPNANKALFQIK